MPRVFIEIGSNTRTEENIRKAIKLLADRTKIVAISTFYISELLGRSNQPHFYNGVVEIETNLPPLEFKNLLLRENKYAPRTIDLDIIIYEDMVISTSHLVIQDPEISNRPFLAIHLYELAPELILPDSGQPLREIANKFSNYNMKALPKYTQLLRKELIYELPKS